MAIKHFIDELQKSERVEGELLRTIFVSLIASFATFALIYYLRLQHINNFIPRYGYFILFSILSYVLIMPAIRQVRAFKKFPCMTGMMVGMTIGMMSGMMLGFFVGAVSGMFWGSVFGMSVGIILGVWKGKCCGVMGVMEGMMAGFMGGLMGAMTAVMMYNDHLRSAGVILFVVCGAILIGLNYMLYTETKHEERQFSEGDFMTIILSVLFTAITIWMVVFGPKSPLFG